MCPSPCVKVLGPRDGTVEGGNRRVWLDGKSYYHLVHILRWHCGTHPLFFPSPLPIPLPSSSSLQVPSLLSLLFLFSPLLSFPFLPSPFSCFVLPDLPSPSLFPSLLSSFILLLLFPPFFPPKLLFLTHSLTMLPWHSLCIPDWT